MHARLKPVVKSCIAVVMMMSFLPAARCPAVAQYTAGHGDLGIAYEDGALHMHVHLHAGAIVDGAALAGDAEYSAAEIIICGGPISQITRPAGAAWDATGVSSGEDLWVLPQHNTEGLPAFGLASEEIGGGVLLDDRVILTLTAVQGPGEFSLWQVDALGQPTFLLSSSEELLATPFGVSEHQHAAWGFTEAGLYEISLTVSAVDAAGESLCSSATYTFDVTPEPATLMLLAAGSATALRRRRR